MPQVVGAIVGQAFAIFDGLFEEVYFCGMHNFIESAYHNAMAQRCKHSASHKENSAVRLRTAVRQSLDVTPASSMDSVDQFVQEVPEPFSLDDIKDAQEKSKERIFAEDLTRALQKAGSTHSCTLAGSDSAGTPSTSRVRFAEGSRGSQKYHPPE